MMIQATISRRTPVPRSDDSRQIAFVIADVARLMRSSFDRRVKRLGLTRSQWLVLRRLHRHPGISQSELAEMLEVERATAGRIIDRMERRGWLVRRPDAADRRINRLYLTAEAEEVEAELGRIARSFVDEAMALLDPEEQDTLAEMMDRVKAKLLAMGARSPKADRAAALAPPP